MGLTGTAVRIYPLGLNCCGVLAAGGDMSLTVSAQDLNEVGKIGPWS